MSGRDHICFVRVGGPRPPFYTIGEHLWGAGADLDSDGDSSDPEASDWTELTLVNRRDTSERIDVDPVQEAPLVLKVKGTTPKLTEQGARYLASVTGRAVISHFHGGA
jgi:hypothetical protein